MGWNVTEKEKWPGRDDETSEQILIKKAHVSKGLML